MRADEFKHYLIDARKKDRPPCFYHRAVTGLKNSKSLNIVTKTLRNKNVDGIEFDLQATSNGKIIVRHDFAIKSDYGYKWIKELTFKQLRNSINETDCPTFDNLIKKIGKTNKIIDIEIKQTGIASRVIKKYKGTKIYRQFVLTTLYEDVFEEIIKTDPNVAWMFGYPRDRGKNLTNRWWAQPIVQPAVQIIKLRLPKNIVPMMEKVPTDFFSFYHKVITKRLVEKLHKNGKFVVGATISLNNDTGKKESIKHMSRMLNAGTDLIKTDYPNLYPEALSTCNNQ